MGTDPGQDRMPHDPPAEQHAIFIPPGQQAIFMPPGQQDDFSALAPTAAIGSAASAKSADRTIKAIKRRITRPRYHAARSALALERSAAERVVRRETPFAARGAKS